jgi:mannose-6-phosphate isomerase-like protein (cupin superfamily)
MSLSRRSGAASIAYKPVTRPWRWHNLRMRYTKIRNTEHGMSGFEDCEISFTSEVFAPPAPPLDVSPAASAREVLFIRLPAGWTDSAHPVPARQWMFVLSGRGEVVAGDETRPWQAGEAFLVEDTTPPGHGTTIIEDTVFAVVRC